MMYTYNQNGVCGSLFALEDIRQFSLVVKKGHGVRYILGADNLRDCQLYFVNHIFSTIDDQNGIIKRGSLVRLEKVSLLFGLIG